MTAADFSAGDFVNQLANAGATSCLELVTLSTGVPGSKKINVRAFTVHTRLVYVSDFQRQHEPSQHRYPALEDLRRPVEVLANSFDCVFIDPWHNLVESFLAIELAVIGVRPGGTVIVHDCHPHDSQLRSFEPPETYPFAWCGSMWMVWSLLISDLPSTYTWLTIDADYGIGVLRAPNSKRELRQLLRRISAVKNAAQAIGFVAPEWAPDPDHLRLVRPDHPLVVGWT